MVVVLVVAGIVVVVALLAVVLVRLFLYTVTVFGEIGLDIYASSLIPLNYLGPA